MVSEFKQIKILFIYTNLSSFVKADLEILQRHFNVKPFKFSGLLSIPALIQGVKWSDVTFSWFADTHAFYAVRFSKFFGKKSIVVVGGYEVAKVPEINYGLMLSSRTSRKVKYVFKNANYILTVDDSLKLDAIRNMGLKGNNIYTVPTGYDSNKLNSHAKKEELVLTVGYVNQTIMKRKGLETFVKSASYLPNTKFVLVGKHVGKSINYLKSIATDNVEFTGFVSDEDLCNLYQRSKVYCQLSIYEGLPNALCEAMLHECVPVGTKACGIPTAIGDTGFYVSYGDPKATAKSIEHALNSDNGKKARERIKEMFPLSRRENSLLLYINN